MLRKEDVRLWDVFVCCESGGLGAAGEEVAIDGDEFWSWYESEVKK